MNFVLNAEEKSLLEQVKKKLPEIGNDRSKLIPLLQLIQEKLAYLPVEAIHVVADHLDISPSEVYGVATFYNQFRFHPPGKNAVKVMEQVRYPKRELRDIGEEVTYGR